MAKERDDILLMERGATDLDSQHQEDESDQNETFNTIRQPDIAPSLHNRSHAPSNEGHKADYPSDPIESDDVMNMPAYLRRVA